nr:class I SAM-dependent methyltransferase [Amycolatopsis jejuensis]
MSGHTHDHIDWADRLALLRAADTLDAPAQASIAERLVAKLPPHPTVIDLGCGAGGMSTHFAQALATRDGGTVILVDATPELLHEAERAVRSAAEHAVRSAVDGAVGPAAGGAVRSAVDGAVGPAAGRAVRSAAERVVGPAREHAIHPAVDGVVRPEAERAVRTPADGGRQAEADSVQTVEVRAVVADLADAGLPGLLPAADLVWASRVVHHLPDQQAAIGTLSAVARDGGVVALAEGGLNFSCLPWDLGVGRPGLEDRLQAAQAEWFVGMREGIDGAVPMPYGWPIALERAGLADVSSFSALVDHPAPGPDGLTDYVHHHLSRLADHGADFLTADDRATLATLLDPDGEHSLAKRRDLYLLGVRTVHHGRRT